MNIAIDAMGGDFAPGAVVQGLALALEAERYGVDEFHLVGDESAIKAELESAGIAGKPGLIIHHASEVVGMGDSAAASVRRKKDSSIAGAVALVKDGVCGALISAGNTGAAVASSTVRLRTLEGISRPGILSPMPNDFGSCNLIDAGANTDAKPEHLLHYAIMGSVYAKHVLNRPSPIVGLMSVGEEDGKGTDFTRHVFDLLKTAPINFKGNVEGHDLFKTELDVVVCDGFTGNIVLKSCEATAKAMFKWLKEELYRTPRTKVGALLAKPAFKAVHEKGNYESYGGSPLLGVNGVCIIGHGSSSPLAIKNALRVAAEALTHDINPRIEEAIATLPTTE